MSPTLPPRHRQTFWIGATAITLFIVLVYGPYLFRTSSFGNLIDADYNLAWQLAVNDAFRHGEVLHWNPHLCGGVPGLATPDTRALSPFMVLAVFPELDPVLQIKVIVLCYLVLNALGFLLLARRMRLHVLFGLLGFFVSAGNGFLAFKVLQGQTIFNPYFLFPILLALVWPSDEPWPGGRPSWWPRLLPDPFPVFAGIAAVTLIILDDGVYVYLHTFMLLGGFVAIVALMERRIDGIVLLSVWVVVPILLCLPRILPAAELLAVHPRLVESVDFMTPKMMGMAYFHPDQVGLYMGYQPSPPHRMWAAYGAYTGVAPFLIAAVAFATPRKKVVWALAACALVGVLLQAGYFAPWSPWALMRKLPGFTQFRSPYRFCWFVINSAAVLSMLGAARIEAFVKSRDAAPWKARAVVAACGLLVAVPLALAMHPLFAKYVRPYELNYFKIHRELPFVQGRFNAYDQYTHTAYNHDVIACWTGLELPNAVQPGPPAGLLPLADDEMDTSDATEASRGTATLTTEPNRLLVDVDPRAPSRLVIQQNFHRDWRVVRPTGAEVEEHAGLLSVRVPTGPQRVELRFVPVAFRRGLALASPVWLGVLALLALWIRAIRARSS